MNEFGAGFTIWADDQASQTIGKVNKNFGEFVQAAQRAAGVLGAAMVGAGVGIARGLEQAMTSAAQLQTAVAEVSTLISEEAFPEADIRAAAQRASLLYGTEAQDNARALYQIISAGITDAAAAQKTMDAANRLAVGGLTSTSIAADGLTNVLLSYRDKQLDVNDVNDAFFTAIRVGKTTAEELASSVGKVASGANVLGVSMDELLGSIAAVTQGGIQTSEAVSGLKAAFSLLNKPQDVAIAEAKRLGVEYSAAAVRAQGWEKWLTGVTSAAGFNADSMTKLFGSIEAYNTMVALASNGGKTFADIMDQMRDRTGAADAAVSKMSATMEHHRKVLDQTMKFIDVLFGRTANDMLEPFVGLISKLAGAFAQLADAIPPEARKAIIAVVGGIAGLLTGVGGIGVLVGGLSLLGISLTTVAAALGIIVGIMIPLSILFAGFGIAMVAAFRAITKHVGAAGDTWQDTVRKIKLGWQGLTDLIGSGKLSQGVQNELGKAENRGVGAFLARAEGWIQRIKAFWSGLTAGFDRGLAKLGPALDKLFEKIGLIGATLGGEATDGLASATAAGERAGAILAQLGEYGIAAMTALVDLGQRLATKLGDVSSQDIADGIYSFVAAFRTLAAVIGPVISHMAWWSENVLGPMAGKVTLVADTFFRVRDAIAEVIKALKGLAGGVPETLGRFFDVLSGNRTPGVKQTLGEIWGGIMEPVKAPWQQLGEAVTTGATGIGGNYADFYAPKGGMLRGAATGAGNALRAFSDATGENAGLTAEQVKAIVQSQPAPRVNATITVSEVGRGMALVTESDQSRGYEEGFTPAPQGAF
jgi:TP901 family phage tail tape measure protein